MNNSVSSQAILAQVDLLKTKFAQQMQEYNDNIDSIITDIKADVRHLNEKFTETRQRIENQLTQSAETIESLNKNIENDFRSI